VIQDVTTGKLRKITPIEAERLNGFPDNWTNTGMTDSRRYFMMGNALVTGVVSKISSKIELIILVINFIFLHSRNSSTHLCLNMLMLCKQS
jgi:hypothetical protein